MQKLRVGFIGLGLMGYPMAMNILRKGFPLGVYNRTSKKTGEFKRLGATIYHSPSELAKNSDVVVTMITGPKDVKDVMLGKNGVAEGVSLARRGLAKLIVVDMSTIGPTAAREIAKGLKKHGVEFLDAPVTGSTDRAKSGELTIFVGGEEKVFKKVKDVLGAMGTNLVYMGGTGYGQAIKLVNNLIAGETIVTLAEAFLLADAMKLSRKKVAAVLQNVFGVSPNMKNKFPNMVSNKFPVAFSVANMRKDLSLALVELGKKKLPILKTSEALYKKGINQGLGDLDLSAVLKVLSK